jgi:hypothetical protein
VLLSRDDGAWDHRILNDVISSHADADADGLFYIDIPKYSDDEDSLSDDDAAVEAKARSFGF